MIKSIKKGTLPRAGGLVALLSAAALALAACGGPAASSSSSSSSGSSSGVVNITWQTMWSGVTLSLINQLVSQFNSTHPDIHVTESNIPSATGDEKLLSEIAAGDPPDVFTEWNSVLGQWAATGAIQPMTHYLTGSYSGLEKWMYPIALQGGVYKGALYAVPMSLNSWALYYNKSIMKAAGISSPPATLAQLYTDQAKEWKISGGKLQQIGFDPGTDGGLETFSSFFGAVNCLNAAGEYDLASCKGAQAEANFLAQYDHYPYGAITAMQDAYGDVAGGDDDAFVAGKEGFELDGPWEGTQSIPATNPGMEHNFGVEAFPGIEPQPSTFGEGNYNIIPKGAAHPQAAFDFIAWLAGYHNLATISKIDPEGGWMPASPQIAAQPAYQAWIKTSPYLQIFVSQMSSPYSVTPALTRTEAQYETAEGTATSDIAEGIKTPQQALAYVDAQANSTTGS
jgi:multiple sugar transport system substrate-binding protein